MQTDSAVSQLAHQEDECKVTQQIDQVGIVCVEEAVFCNNNKCSCGAGCVSDTVLGTSRILHHLILTMR